MVKISQKSIILHNNSVSFKQNMTIALNIGSTSENKRLSSLPRHLHNKTTTTATTTSFE